MAARRLRRSDFGNILVHYVAVHYVAVHYVAMDPDHLRQIEQFYHAVLLEQADPLLRREVQALLDQDDFVGPMDRPPAGILEDSVTDLGRVYRARDTRLGPQRRRQSS